MSNIQIHKPTNGAELLPIMSAWLKGTRVEGRVNADHLWIHVPPPASRLSLPWFDGSEYRIIETSVSVSILYRPANTLTVITSKSTYTSVKEAHQDLEDNDAPYPNVYGFLETTITGEEVSVKLFQDYS
jgi:hypothetical protein